MLRFLRKYQLIIMAVGGSLLMVAFLLSSVLQQLPRMGFSSTIATVDVAGRSQKVKNLEYSDAGREVEFLKTLFGSPTSNPIESMINPPGAMENDPEYIPFEGNMHWILLKREAERAGLIGGPSEGDGMLESMIASFTLNFGDEETARNLVNDLFIRGLRTVGFSPDEGRQALANFIGVQRLINLYRSAGVASENRLRQLARDLYYRVSVDLIPIEADQFIDEQPEPTEEEIQAHFEKYAAIEPGEGEYGLGYRQPDRLKFEYLRIPYTSILEQVDATGLDARTWFMQNPGAYPLAPEQEEVPAYEEIAGDVMILYRREQAEQKVREIVRSIKTALYRSMQGIERRGEYYDLPDDWSERQLSFEALREQLQNEFDVEVEYVAETGEWHELSALAMDFRDGIGRAALRSGSRVTRFPQLMESVREFGSPQIPGLQAGVAGQEPLRSYVTSPLRRGPMVPEDLYFYRVTEVDPERPAQTPDEVREQIVRDLKRIAAFNELAANAEEWRRRALDEGFDALAESLETRVVPSSVTRYSIFALRQDGTLEYAPITPLGASPELSEKILAIVAPLEPLAIVEESIPEAERTIVHPVENGLTLAIVRVTNHTPVSKERYQALLSRGLQVGGAQVSLDEALTLDETIEIEESPWSYDRLKTQYRVVMRDPGDDEEGAIGEDEVDDVEVSAEDATG
ncbi:MAG: hypothetical protein ACF8PN_10125 [Phycisphaerales bacterium]